MQVETPSGSEPSFKLEYDPALPITAHRKEVIEAIQRNQVIVLCGATGSGKSTQLPKLCVEAGRGVGGVIGHTQPRRIAARALASRVAEETGTTVGGAIGFKVRFTDRTGPNCRIKLMTDGILLKELETDRKLRRYDTLIIDEAHERSLNIDLLLGVLKQLLPQRPDLRLIVTSATIDPGKFATFFGGAPVIEVSGRSYPVEVRYRPLIAARDSESSAFVEHEDSAIAADDAEDTVELTLPEGIVEAVRELPRDDVLVFLPGEKHIREAAEALEKARLHSTEILPLFARLSTSDQERIFQRHSSRRVVLATNVAETSLTVPGIRNVIDSGLARISRYSVRGKVQRLPIERVSKASADQRKGRCGREAEGICIRLYSEEDFSQREDFTPPEVLRTNLASVILRMATLGLGDPESFPFLDPPDTRLVNDGIRLLQELKAMDEDRRVTSLGQQIAGIPVDPRLGRMLLAASRQHCLTEMLVVASFLEGQDPRERPSDAKQQAAEKHALFADNRSDFITVLNVWKAFVEQSSILSRNQLRKWCREHFLSFLRMREWQDLHTQLSRSVEELKLRLNQQAANYTDLHQAILTGFLGSIGELDEKREYNGPRGLRFVVAPGTPLAGKPPRWIVAGSLVETTRLYARMVAGVDPGWIEAAGAHLLKRTYTEPHWVEARGFVSAYESVALYGLTLASKRRVNYGQIVPREARDIFIREALILKERGVESSAEVATYLGGTGRRSNSFTSAERNSAMAAMDDDAGGEDPRRPSAPRPHQRSRVEVSGDFVQSNRALLREVEALEAKIRRRDVVVDEGRQFEFFSSRIPHRVNSVSAFNHWRVDAERTNPRLLHMSRTDLMAREVPEADASLFPNEFAVGGNMLPLVYKFDPAEPGDGVTLVVPEPLLDVVNSEQIAWLVPGLRLEKVTSLFRALPKAQRKLLVPVPDHAKRALDDFSAESSRLGRMPGFHDWLAEWITGQVGSPVTAGELSALPLPDYLRMNLRVLDAEDKVLAEGRDLLALRRQLYAAGVPTLGVVGGGLSGGGLGARVGGGQAGDVGGRGGSRGGSVGGGAVVAARGGRESGFASGADAAHRGTGNVGGGRSGQRGDAARSGRAAGPAGVSAAHGGAGRDVEGGPSGGGGRGGAGGNAGGVGRHGDAAPGGRAADSASGGGRGSGGRGGVGTSAGGGHGVVDPQRPGAAADVRGAIQPERSGAAASGVRASSAAAPVATSKGRGMQCGGSFAEMLLAAGVRAGGDAQDDAAGRREAERDARREHARAGNQAAPGVRANVAQGSAGGGGGVHDNTQSRGAYGDAGQRDDRHTDSRARGAGGRGERESANQPKRPDATSGARAGGMAALGALVNAKSGVVHDNTQPRSGGGGVNRQQARVGNQPAGAAQANTKPGVAHGNTKSGLAHANTKPGGAHAGGVPAAAHSAGLLHGGAAPQVLHKAWDFGELPASREVERNRLRLVVYPAIEDRGAGVALVEARNAPVAEAISRTGVVRLAMLALPQQAKFVHKRTTDDRDLVLLSRGLPFGQSVADALTQRAFHECFLPSERPLPRDAQAFTKVLDDHRSQLNDVADRLTNIVTSILKEWRAARAALDGLRGGSYGDAVADMDAQLALLLPPDFIETTPRPWLDYLSRYLKGITRRAEKLPPNVRRDAELAAKVRPYFTTMRTLLAQPNLNGSRPELDQLRWMIEEFRVSLFAQELRTMVKVSEKRLEEQLELARDEQR